VKSAVTRSALLKAAGGALVVSFALPLTRRAADAASPGRPNPAQLDSWLAVSRDGTITTYTGRVDFGQHKRIAFAQIVAEELDVPVAAVTVIMGDTSLTVNQGASSASNGISAGAKPLRHAAAEARFVLLNLAAKRLGVPVDQLRVKDGVVRVVADSAKAIAYGELLDDRRFNVVMKVTNDDTLALDITGQSQPKDPSLYTLVGKPLPATEIPFMVRATWPRVHNVRLPGMLYAQLVLPPTPGAHVINVGALGTRIPDVVRIVAKGDFVAVVATTEWAAIRGAQALDVTWSRAETLPRDGNVFAYLRSATPQPDFPQRNVKSTGDAESVIHAASKTYAAEYHFPMQSHGMIGPSCGVADVVGNEATVYAGTQDPAETRSSIATLLDIPEQNVRLIPVEPSGCYGRLNIDDATVAAAYLSQQVRRPVRVQFTRGQEHTWEVFQPPSTFSMRAAVDASGQVVAWEQNEWTWSWTENELPSMLLAKAAIIGTAPPLFRPPGGGDFSNYPFPNLQVLGNTVAPLLRGTQMRSPGRIQANFASEQFMDEMAAAANEDAIAFRLRHGLDDRATAVLKEVAKTSGWRSRPSPNPDATSNARIARGRGVALVSSQKGTYVATVAEVAVDRQTGNVRVEKMTVAVDAGLIINPSGMRAQVEGATLFATSRTLKEAVTFDRARVTSSDWLSYPILRFTEIPDIQISLINRVDLPAGGIGEPPNTTPPAAIGNAIYDALGVRIRELPFTRDRVKAALRAAGA
jgi:nicotinate dehydrogenase subunit B